VPGTPRRIQPINPSQGVIMKSNLLQFPPESRAEKFRVIINIPRRDHSVPAARLEMQNAQGKSTMAWRNRFFQKIQIPWFNFLVGLIAQFTNCDQSRPDQIFK